MHVRDQVDRHEADIMPVHRILGSGIAQAHPDLHRVKLPISKPPFALSLSNDPASSKRAGLRQAQPERGLSEPIKGPRSEEHKSEIQSPMRTSYAVIRLKNKKQHPTK